MHFGSECVVSFLTSEEMTATEEAASGAHSASVREGSAWKGGVRVEAQIGQRQSKVGAVLTHLTASRYTGRPPQGGGRCR